MRFRVQVAVGARQDALRYAEWIAGRSPRAAATWYVGLSRAVRSLARMPLRCAMAPEAVIAGVPVRHLLFKSHRVLFVVHEGTVYVLHIRHSAMRRANPDELGLAGEK